METRTTSMDELVSALGEQAGTPAADVARDLLFMLTLPAAGCVGFESFPKTVQSFVVDRMLELGLTADDPARLAAAVREHFSQSRYQTSPVMLQVRGLIQAQTGDVWPAEAAHALVMKAETELVGLMLSPRAPSSKSLSPVQLQCRNRNTGTTS